MAKGIDKNQANDSTLEFEAQSWAAAAKMRGHMEVNPPFNMSNWGGENLQQDVRWKFGMPQVNKVACGNLLEELSLSA
jgi:hypothetical protein